MDFYERSERNVLVIKDVESMREYLIGAKEFKDVSWKEKLDLLGKFFEKYGKRPLYRSKDGNEKVLATWISTQLKNRPKNKEIMASAKIRDIWDAFKIKYIEYLKSNEENWYENLEEARLFFETNKKRPYEKAKDKKEKVLGNWISNQLQNRPKNQKSMASAEISDVWDAFKNKYIEYFRSNEEIWYENLEAVKLYFETNGKRPSQTAKDKNEKVLANWLSTQLQNRPTNQHIMASAEIRDVWDAFKNKYIEYLRSYEETWYENLEAVRLFFETNGKRPSQTAKDKKEKVLGSWISHQLKNRQINQHIMVSAEIRDVWDAFKIKYIEYFRSYEEIWYENLEAVKLFFETNGKRPSQKDKNEKVLGKWLSHQLQNRPNNQYSMASAEIRDVWDAFKTKYIEYLRSNEETWYENLEAVRLFFETNGKRPSYSAKDKNEKVLGKWISHQSQNRPKNKEIMASAEIRDVWDAFKNKYIEYLRSNEETWYENLEAARLFFETNGKRPSSTAKDKKEKVLASWISHQLANRAKSKEIMASAEICDVWDAFKNKYIEYLRSYEETWYENLEAVKLFVETNGKRPSSTAKDKNEKVLATWIGTQLKNRPKNKEIMVNEEIRDIWDAFKNKYIEYFRSNEETWYENLEALRLFLETNGKRPSHSAKDKKEKVLATWIGTQLQNRAKNQYIMASAEIRDVWDAFVNTI